MLSKIFWAQWGNPNKFDWTLEEIKNLKETEVTTDLEEIKSMSKNSFKRLVMKKAKEYESNEDGDEAVACSNDGGIIKHPALSFIKDFFKDISTEIENLGLISVFHPKYCRRLELLAFQDCEYLN